MNILELLRNQLNKQTLSKQEALAQNELRAMYPNVPAEGTYALEMRSLTKSSRVDNFTNKTLDIDDAFLDRIFVLRNARGPLTNVPYISIDNAQWKATGTAPEINGTLTTEKLSPKRLATFVDISREFINFDNADFSEKINTMIVRAVYDKLVETILSDDAATDDQPAGVFNTLTPTSLTADETLKSQLAAMQYSGDLTKKPCVWLLSPKAKKEVFANLDIQNDKILGSEYIIDNRMKDGFIAYLPLDLFFVAEYGLVDLTVDAVTRLFPEGMVRLTVNAYYDYDFVDKSKIQLAEFSTSEAEQEPSTEPTEPSTEPSTEPEQETTEP